MKNINKLLPFISYQLGNLILLIFLLFANKLHAQIPPSPNSMGLVRDANVPVNLYTGIPQITVPLFDLPHDKGYSIPVYLSYHAGGHKIQDVAGPVGLGWTLHGGGTITRVVRGNPDNGEMARPNSIDEWGDEIGLGADHPQFPGLNSDLEYDLFFFSLPSGYSSKFIVKSNGDAFTIPHSNYKINMIGDFDNAKWSITDDNGNVFKFNWGGSEFEKTRYTVSENDGSYDPTKSIEYVSSWFLTTVDRYQSVDDINYSYIGNKGNYSYETYNKVYNINWEPCSRTVHGNSINKSNIKLEIVSPKYLSEIETRKGFIEFDWSPSRKDIGTTYLENVTLKNKSEDFVSRYELDYSYADSYDAELYFSFPYSSDWSANNNDRYRLMLEDLSLVTRKGVSMPFRKFHYRNNIEFKTGTLGPLDLYELPPRNSFQQDHWGYHSISYIDNAEYRPKIVAKMENQSNPSILLLDGHHRNPDPELAQSNILYKIEDLRNGNETIFTYELNEGIDYKNKHLYAAAPIEAVGGLRIKSIENKNVLDEEGIITNYEYGRGVFRYKPIHHFNYYKRSSPYTEYLLNSDHKFYAGECYNVSTIVSDQTFNSLYDVNGVSVEYISVKVHKSGFGIQEYEYYTSLDDNLADELPTREVFGYGDPMATYSGNSEYGSPFAPLTTYFWKRGMLKKESFYTNDESILESKEYKYLLDYTQSPTFFSQKAIKIGSHVFVNSYKNIISSRPVWKIIHKKYAKENPNSFQKTESQTLYKENPLRPFNTWITYDDGSQHNISPIYIADICVGTPPTFAQTSANALWRMKNDNAIAQPIEKVIGFRKSDTESYKIISANVTKFINDADNGLVLPSTIYSLDVSEPIQSGDFSHSKLVSNNTMFEIDSRYNSPSKVFFYDTSGDLISTKGRDGILQTFEFDGNGYLEKVRFGSEERVLSYVNEPLVGLQYESDINGKSIKYEYDNQNRPYLVKDQNNNIIKRYKYHFKSDVPDFLTGDIYIYGTTKTGNTLDFVAAEITGYGGSDATQYKWDINGTSYEGKRLDDIPFPTAGRYIITLSLLNPEYDEPFTTATAFSVADDPLLPVVTGSSHYNACDYQSGDYVRFNQVRNIESPGYLCYNGGNEQTGRWEYKEAGSSGWQEFNGTLGDNHLDHAGVYSIRYTLVDGCNQSRTSGIHDFTVTSNCGDGNGDPNFGEQH